MKQIKTLVICCLIINCLPLLSKAKQATKPNIVIIVSDDHSYQSISAYGSKLMNTPNIDRIAKGGIRFDKAYVINSVCGPSQAAILTGKYSHKNGFRDNENSKFNGNQDSFIKQLSKGGYQTAWIGKWHLENIPQGFDFWQILPGQGQYYLQKDPNEMRNLYSQDKYKKVIAEMNIQLNKLIDQYDDQDAKKILANK